MKLFDQLRRSESSALRLDGAPQAGDVIIEIGLVLAVHLAFALAVGLTLNALGIV
jgi:hypothetical protein